jgi:hypothetical protein
MNIIFSEDDLDSTVDADQCSGFVITDEDSADKFITDNTPNTLVSYVAVPTDPVNGSYCYKMLIDSQTHTLYYFRKQRINRSFNVGFTPEDIERITAHRIKVKKK